MPEYGASLSLICAQLALHPKRLRGSLTALALEAIKREIYPELAAEILDANLDKSKFATGRENSEGIDRMAVVLPTDWRVFRRRTRVSL